MSSTINDFVAETRGHCFLCSNKISCQPPSSTRLGSGLSSTHSLNGLSRYLGMDMKKAFTGSGPIPPDLVARLEKSKLRAELCKECASLIQTFSELFRRLEKVEMEVASCLNLIQGKLVSALFSSKNDSSVASATSKLDSEWFAKLEITEALRKDAVQKCSHKLRTPSRCPVTKVPRLSLKQIKRENPKIKITSGNGSRNQDSASNDGHKDYKSPPSAPMADHVETDYPNHDNQYSCDSHPQTEYDVKRIEAVEKAAIEGSQDPIEQLANEQMFEEGNATDSGTEGDAVAALDRFPSEIWNIILKALDDADDFLNVFLSCRELNAIVRRDWSNRLRPPVRVVLPFVAPYLSKEDILRCRLVSRKFCSGVEKSLDQQPFYHFVDQPILRRNFYYSHREEEKDRVYYTNDQSRQFYTKIATSNDPEIVGKLIEPFETHNFVSRRNPFVGRSLLLDVHRYKENREVIPNLIESLLSCSSVQGHIRNVTINLSDTELNYNDTLELNRLLSNVLQQLLTSIVNIRFIRVILRRPSSYCWWGSEVDHPDMDYTMPILGHSDPISIEFVQHDVGRQANGLGLLKLAIFNQYHSQLVKFQVDVKLLNGSLPKYHCPNLKCLEAVNVIRSNNDFLFLEKFDAPLLYNLRLDYKDGGPCDVSEQYVMSIGRMLKRFPRIQKLKFHPRPYNGMSFWDEGDHKILFWSMLPATVQECHWITEGCCDMDGFTCMSQTLLKRPPCEYYSALRLTWNKIEHLFSVEAPLLRTLNLMISGNLVDMRALEDVLRRFPRLRSLRINGGGHPIQLVFKACKVEWRSPTQNSCSAHPGPRSAKDEAVRRHDWNHHVNMIWKLLAPKVDNLRLNGHEFARPNKKR